jgi:outer membrane lipoprotein-sorting protein
MKILAAVAAMIFFAVGALAETTNDLSEAQIQGRKLAQQLLEQQPTTNFFQNGHLNIRDSKNSRVDLPILFYSEVHIANWEATYQIPSGSNAVVLIVVHSASEPNQYFIHNGQLIKTDIQTSLSLSGDKIITPFANSDFWIADLGLEFFHWPEQKILRKELKRSRGCNVLESTNPNLSANGYSRVVSWIDEETFGIVHAEAYDFKNKLLKEFDPKSFKKVNGQWELQEMEIRNVQTGSRSRIQFDLNKQ